MSRTYPPYAPRRPYDEKRVHATATSLQRTRPPGTATFSSCAASRSSSSSFGSGIRAVPAMLAPGNRSALMVAKLGPLSRSMLEFAGMMTTAQKQPWVLVTRDSHEIREPTLCREDRGLPQRSTCRRSAKHQWPPRRRQFVVASVEKRSITVHLASPNMSLEKWSQCIVVALLPVILAACDVNAVDPTDPGYKAVIANDLPVAIVVRNDQEDLPLRPGGSDVFSPGPVNTVRYTVTGPHGRLRGCLFVRLDARKTVRALASGLRPC